MEGNARRKIGGVVLGLLLLMAVQATAGQLLENPGFECRDNDWFSAWQRTGTVASVVASTQYSSTGEFSVRFVAVTVAYEGRGIVSDPVPVVAGEDYTFGISVYVPAVDADPSDYLVFVQIEWTVEGDEQPRSYPTAGQRLTAFDEWQKLQYSARAPAGAASAKLRVRVKRAQVGDPRADVFVDDAFLTGPPSVAVVIAEAFDELSLDDTRGLVARYGRRHVHLAFTEAGDYQEFMRLVEGQYLIEVIGEPIVVDTEGEELVVLKLLDVDGCVWVGLSSHDSRTNRYQARIDTESLEAGGYTLYIGASAHTVTLLDWTPERALLE